MKDGVFFAKKTLGGLSQCFNLTFWGGAILDFQFFEF